jgi:LysM repeat protein
VEKVAGKATKAAPAAAIAGALVATAPQAHAAVRAPVTATSVAGHVHTDAVIARSQPANRTYTVRPGDTLSTIARHFYGGAADWPSLYHANESVISNPNDIYAGEVLKVTAAPTANAASYAASYAPKHAKTGTTLTTSATRMSGTLGCSGLEALWKSAGGSSAEAFMAAEIAMAESGGNQYALSPTNDYGYWQINGSHGALATFSAYGNARAAVIISSDGTDWYPWTTYVTGAYKGRC